MFRFAIKMAMFCMAGFLLFCERDFSGRIIQNQKKGNRHIVTLQNQNEHSGIMLRIVELDTFVLTDSCGHFEFPKLPDGNYTFEARYPYFDSKQMNILITENMIQSEVQIELKQLFQFWIEPAEISISKSNIGDPDFFSVAGLRQYRVNITESTLTVRSGLDPLDYWAFYPEGFDWPYIPNPDSLQDFCYANYGWMGRNDLFHDIDLIFQPNDTTWVSVPQPSIMLKDCFYQGAYKFYSSVTDTYNYPEYFHPAFVRNLRSPNHGLYDQMNRSLFKKTQLFRPAKLNITN